LLAYEHWLVRPDDLKRVNQAFFHVNGIISVGLLLIVLLQLAVHP
jgi:4-hydroxybenzoate polyprenyltransferase